MGRDVRGDSDGRMGVLEVDFVSAKGTHGVHEEGHVRVRCLHGLAEGEEGHNVVGREARAREGALPMASMGLMVPAVVWPRPSGVTVEGVREKGKG
jgi:hypothetical protein